MLKNYSISTLKIWISKTIQLNTQKSISGKFLIFIKYELKRSSFKTFNNIVGKTTAYPWCDGHSTSINVCGVLGARAGVQISKTKLHTHIHLD